MHDACGMTDITSELIELTRTLRDVIAVSRKGFDVHSRQLERQGEQIIRLMERLDRLELIESARMVDADEVADAILRDHERGEE